MNHPKPFLAIALATLLASATPAAQAAPATTAEREELTRQLQDAQSQIIQLGERISKLTSALGGSSARVEMYRYLGDPDRAMYGLVVDEVTDQGVPISAVTPGGPAEAGGLRPGDIIKAVRRLGSANPTPLNTLGAAFNSVKVGDVVVIDYEREGAAAKVELAAERQVALDVLPRMLLRSAPGSGILTSATWVSEPGSAESSASGEDDARPLLRSALVFGATFGLRLAAMNPELGRYFGVRDGVLVLGLDDSGYQGLEAGDVILEVAGKPVKHPREAMHELGKHSAEYPVELKVQRDQVTLLTKVTVPADGQVVRSFTPLPADAKPAVL